MVTLFAALLLCSYSVAGNAVNYEYDDAGRLVAAFYGGEKSIVYGYDAKGNLVTYSAHGGVKRGDLNLDDAVDIADALAGLRLLSGLPPVDNMDIAGYLESQLDVIHVLGLSEITYILQNIAELR